MKSKIKFLLAPLSIIITQLALSGVCSASCGFYCQPKAPKQLATHKKL